MTLSSQYHKNIPLCYEAFELMTQAKHAGKIIVAISKTNSNQIFNPNASYLYRVDFVV